MLVPRPTWDTCWMATADIIAERSLCSRAKVGAVIVSSDNVVQAASHNGPPPAFEHGGTPCTSWCPRAMGGRPAEVGYHDCVATHAELNALVRADASKLKGATMYISGAVCSECAKVIPQTGIVRVVQRVHASDSHRRPDEVEEYLRKMGMEVVRYDS